MTELSKEKGIRKAVKALSTANSKYKRAKKDIFPEEAAEPKKQGGMKTSGKKKENSKDKIAKTGLEMDKKKRKETKMEPSAPKKKKTKSAVKPEQEVVSAPKVVDKNLEKEKTSEKKPSKAKSGKSNIGALRQTIENQVTSISGNLKESKLRKMFVKESRSSGKGIKIIPLGGLLHIGMNITAIEYENDIIVVDCGLSFPEDDMLGIDCVIPNVSYLKENIDRVRAFVITHGHEDHIGALPYILKEVNVPVYATRLTVAIIESKLSEKNMLKTTKRKIVKYGQSINLGCFRVEFIRTNHSISDAAALAIYTPVGTILHTGDFKVDYTPVFGDPIDLQRLGEIGRKGVLALLCESTNVMKPGFTLSEKSVGKTLDGLFREHRNSRIIIATFASNVDRVQQIISTAENYGRKVVVDGRSMVNILSIAREIGYITLKENTLIDINQMKDYPDEQIVLITTGSQGEAMAALPRMAASIHKKISIKPGDTIIFSSTPIPGNEKSVTKVINELYMQGANVVFQDTHVSGHACQEEIKLMYSLIKPKFAIPIHGEYLHLIKHADLAVEMGIPKENVIVLRNGNVLEVKEDGWKVIDQVECKGVMVDGLGIGDVGNSVMRDRQKLSEDGLVIVTLSMEEGSNQVLSEPELVSKGFIYVKETDTIMDEALQVVNDAIYRSRHKGIYDRNKLKNEIRDALSDFIWRQTKRSPMIIPVIVDIPLY